MAVDSMIWNNYGKLLILLTAITVILQCYHIFFVFQLQTNDLQMAKKKAIQLYKKIPLGLLQKMVDRLKNAHKMDSSGTYIIVPDLAPQIMDFSNSNMSNLTVCTQTTVKNLFRLPDLLKVWRGPVSVTVFAHGKDILLAAYTIAYYTSCFDSIASQVSFHLAFPIKHPSENLDDLLKVDPKCGKNRFTRSNDSLNYANTEVPYPHNMLRNVAIQFSKTPYILVLDVDIVPSVDLQSDFMKFIHRRSKTRDDKVVYVLPVFESKSGQLTFDKKALLNDWEAELVRPFYEKTCVRCQRPMDYKRWRKLPNMGFLDIGYTLDWQDPWEPFYIARKDNLPLYDGRFKQYGFNRISQVCELHMAGYKFAVLNNAFVVHQGFKEPDSFHKTRTEENDRNRNLFRQFKLELKLRYPQADKQC